MPHSTYAAQTSADRLEALIEQQGQPVVINRGIERKRYERMAARLSLTPHPKALGNKLTHPSITTDFGITARADHASLSIGRCAASRLNSNPSVCGAAAGRAPLAWLNAVHFAR